MTASDRLALVYVQCGRSEAERAGYRGPGRDYAPCFELYRVEWLGTLEAPDGDRLLCRFRAPDAEAVRVVFRNLGIRIDGLWVDNAAVAAAGVELRRATRNLRSGNVCSSTSRAGRGRWS